MPLSEFRALLCQLINFCFGGNYATFWCFCNYSFKKAMTGKIIIIMYLSLIIHYRKKGVKNRKISKLLGINWNTVNAYVRMLNNISRLSCRIIQIQPGLAPWEDHRGVLVRHQWLPTDQIPASKSSRCSQTRSRQAGWSHAFPTRWSLRLGRNQ